MFHVICVMHAVAARLFNGVVGSPSTGLTRPFALSVPRGEGLPMDCTDLLLRLSLHDERVMTDLLDGADTQSQRLDPVSIREREVA